MNRRAIRKLTNVLALALSGLATAVGLFFLGAILWTLIRNGLAGMSLSLFTTMNNAKKPFDDVRVRMALNLAVDKAAYRKVIWSGYADEQFSPMAHVLCAIVWGPGYFCPPSR